MDASRDVVIAGYDGSESAGQAVEWAAIQARARGLPLAVLCVVDDRMDFIDSRLLHAHLLEAAASDVASKGVEKAVKAAPGTEVQAVVRVGRSAATLVEASRDAALMVLGWRGHRGVTATVMGSVSAAVSAHASCPVVVIGESPPPPLNSDHPVVAGVDASAASESAVRFAAETAALMRCPLTLVAAYQTDVIDPDLAGDLLTLEWQGAPVFAAAARESAENATTVGAALATVLEPGLDVRCVAMEGPAPGSLAAAAAGSGLLVLGRRGAGGFDGLQMGSVTRALLHRAPCPIAVVPMGAENRPAERSRPGEGS